MSYLYCFKKKEKTSAQKYQKNKLSLILKNTNHSQYVVQYISLKLLTNANHQTTNEK